MGWLKVKGKVARKMGAATAAPAVAHSIIPIARFLIIKIALRMFRSPHWFHSLTPSQTLEAMGIRHVASMVQELSRSAELHEFNALVRRQTVMCKILRQVTIARPRHRYAASQATCRGKFD